MESRVVVTLYEQRKREIVEQLQNAPGQVTLKKNASNLFRYRPKEHENRLDAHRLNHVLSIDAKARVAEVEGMTTYETLAAETLKCGLTPAVVPELPAVFQNAAAPKPLSVAAFTFVSPAPFPLN